MTALAVLALALGQVAEIHADLASLPDEVRPLVRYLDMSNLTVEEREKAYQVLAGHVNGLSKEADFTAPALVKGRLLRVNLADYLWDAKTWEEFAKTDPYFHLEIEQRYPWGGGIWPGTNQHYAAGSFTVIDKKNVLAPWLAETEVEKKLLAEIIGSVQSQAFILRADWWMVNTATQEGRTVGYYGMLGLKDQKDFEKLVRFDKIQASRLEQRRTVIFSGITLQPRRIERTATVLGGLWRTSDSANAVAKHNPLAFLDDDLEFDATEQFAPLPNGMPAWWLGDAKGKRQDKAPDNVVGGDRTGHGNDTRLHINLSCIRCHMLRAGEAGIKNIDDVKVKTLRADDYQKLRDLRRQYLRDIGPSMEADRKGYELAIKTATGGMPSKEYAAAYAEFYSRYEDARIDLARAAADLGTTEEKLKAALIRQERYVKTGLHPVLSVLAGGGEIPVRQWEELYGVSQTILRGIQP